MKLKLKNTPEQVELIQAMASKDKSKSIEAQEAFAKLIGPVALQVLNKMGTTNAIFEEFKFNEDEDPEIALDLYYDANVDHIQTWHAGVGGSAPTNEVSGMKTLKLHWTEIESAVSLNKRYIERNNLNVVSAAMNRLMQEILRKKELLGWSTIMRALAEGSTNGADHIIAAGTANTFLPDDFNRLIVLSKRMNTSFDSGTPVQPFSNGATDLFISPEVMGYIREMAYNPVSTKQSPSGTTSIPAPEAVRNQLWGASGLTEFFGKTIHELNELGDGQVYNAIFGAYASGNIAPGGGAFVPASTEIAVGIDMSKGSLISPTATFAESDSTLEVMVDDTFQFARMKKLGWWAKQQMSFAVIDSRSLVGVTI